MSKNSSLLRSGSVVAVMTLLSRILGFVRDQVLAIVFGAGATTDVFLVAFKIPNFLRRLFSEGAFAQAFVPVFTEYKETRSPDALKDLAAHVVGTLSLVLLIISTLGVMLAPFLVMLFAPGFIDDQDKFDLATHMLRITFPYLLFVSLLAYAGSILNTFGRFAIPAFTPVLLNVSMIIAALLISPQFAEPIVALAWGVFFAGVVQLALQFPFLSSLGLLPRPRWGWKHSGVRRVLKLMAPAVLGSSVAQINLLLDTIIASFLITGSLSWLYYSDRLMQFPLGLLGVTLGTVILPRLSREHAQRSATGYVQTLHWAIRLALLFGVPAATALFLLAEPMIITLFEYGKFTASDSKMSSFSLMAYAFGLPAFILIKILAPAFFARQDTKTPVRIGIIALLSNMAYTLILVLPMVWFDFIAPHTGLALATTLSAWQQTGMLYQKLQRLDFYRLSPDVLNFGKKVLIATVTMGIALYLLTQLDWHALDAGTRAIRLISAIIAGSIVYAATLFCLGVRPRALTSP
ncbi:MAG: murein biosynthesis integral membrane protein MurJ [Gammaproteobacteria bacterium]|nr:murein biosynthesis integral membrane protein MurJ [Gammaproteobacteria bacterium]